MVDFLLQLFDAADFIPRGRCGAWTPRMAAAAQVSNALMAAACFAIALALGVLRHRRRADLDHPGLLLALAAAYGLGGLTHLLDALAFRWPAYRLFLAVDVLAAAVAVALALSLPGAVAWSLRQPTRAERDRLLRAKEAAERRTEALVADLRGQLAEKMRQRKRLSPGDSGFAVGAGWASLDDQIRQLRGLLNRDDERAAAATNGNGNGGGEPEAEEAGP